MEQSNFENLVFNCRHGSVFYHNTPWNTKALLGRSLEIDNIEFIQGFEFNLINDFCVQKSKELYALIAVRIPSSRNEIKKVYYQCGFITVEHTLDVSLNGLNSDQIKLLSDKFPMIIEDYSISDIADLENLAATEFNFGRYYEDPFIEDEIAKNRSKFWIKDLIRQNAIIKVVKKKNKVIGFIAYKIHNFRADLLLGGVKSNYRHLSYGFWANVLINLKDMNEIHTVISSSNTAVLNLYSVLGFRFENAQFGLHKHL